MDEYLRTSQLIDCTGQVTHTLTLQVDGSIKISFPTGIEAVVDPITRTCRTPGMVIPEQLWSDITAMSV